MCFRIYEKVQKKTPDMIFIKKLFFQFLTSKKEIILDCQETFFM